MEHIDFNHFIKEHSLEDADDEETCLSLLQQLSKCKKPRVMLENFPKNTFQAKFFLRNIKEPSHVFALDCSKETCQERMSEKEGTDSYVPSTILS
jgi:adenylate kinase family enzyme